jgi:hypothetical protein
MTKIPESASLKFDEPSSNGADPDIAASAAAFDPFDPENLKIDAMEDLAIEKVLTAVPVRKPDRREFFRVHPDPAFAVDTLVLERHDGMDRQSYLVAPEIQHMVLPEMHRVRLHTAITRRGVVFLWPIKLPLEDSDRLRRLSDTALLAAGQAKTLWVRIAWSRDLGGYEMFRAKGDLGDPVWPPNSFRDLIELAFRHYRIDRADHDVIKELEGELL